MLKPGGYMLYSTCTFSPEENEGTISYLMEQYPEFHVVNALPDLQTQKDVGISYEGFDTGKPEWVGGSGELKNCLRLWPHRINGEGHFVTLLHKNENESFPEQDRDASVVSKGSGRQDAFRNDYSTGGSNSKNKVSLSDEALDFIKKLNFPLRLEQLIIREDRVYYLPEGLPDLKGLRILRQGLLLGEMKKQRFEPSQALANALKITEYQKIIKLSVDDPNVIRYLKCEAIVLEGTYEDGWYLVCDENYPLGWMKVANNNFENKYLPGWRWI
jgi:NOL1/NOP2/fmu family ribosome biogenesis protein